MTVTAISHARRELAHRVGDGLEVTLCWRPGDDEISVWVSDQRRGALFVIRPEPHLALDVFYHPYAYVSQSDAHYEDERLAA